MTTLLLCVERMINTNPGWLEFIGCVTNYPMEWKLLNAMITREGKLLIGLQRYSNYFYIFR